MEKFHGREVGGRALRLDIAEDRPRQARPRRDFHSDRGGRAFARRDPGAPPPTPQDDYGRGDNYDRGSYDREDDGYGGRGGRSFEKPKRPKGSRRGLRGKKRSL